MPYNVERYVYQILKNLIFLDTSSFGQPFEDFTKITQKLIHSLFIFVSLGHFSLRSTFSSHHIKFGISYLRSLSLQMIEISLLSINHMLMACDQTTSLSSGIGSLYRHAFNPITRPSTISLAIEIHKLLNKPG